MMAGPMPIPATKPRTSGRGAILIKADRARGNLIAGADEAGRGCLAGPIVAAGVRLDLRLLGRAEVRRLARLDDSKRVPAQYREELAVAILEIASAVAVIVRSADTIDVNGLHVTNLTILGEALGAVDAPGAELLSDGFSAPLPAGGRSVAMIKGDRTSAAIAAASIIAKTVRDRVMRQQAHERWPLFGFDSHVGYATPVHHDAIRAHGPLGIHRRSFASTAYEPLVATATA